MSERERFVREHSRGRVTMTDLCAQFGISRKTGYKLLKRFREVGADGFRDRSRAPRSHPNRTPPDVVDRIVEMRRQRPTWGSKKILWRLSRDDPRTSWPARSTADLILKRAGLVPDHPRKRRQEAREAPVVAAAEANDVWTADYKGWFLQGDGTRCDPLTINDMVSRYSLRCTAMHNPNWEAVKGEFEKCFRVFGMPRAILTDNGTPFGTHGICGLSRLSVWFLRLGITPGHIQRGKPYQNGKHERFHKTLKAETATPPKKNLLAQQRAFNRFRMVYNEERPHEALDQRTPTELYESSPRPYQPKPPDFTYSDLETRRINRHGYMHWRGARVFVGQALRGQTIGLEHAEDRLWILYLGPVCLGVFDENAMALEEARRD